MCIIIIGKMTKEINDLAKLQNPDGFSLFTKEQGLVKSPDDKQVRKAFDEFGIWHYRIGTSGAKDKRNIHPFSICKGKYLLYHNGVLGAGKGTMSDTAALAETLSYVTPQTARSVLQALSGGQRFVMVSANDPTKFELFGTWVVEGGVIMSHALYKPCVSKSTSYSYKTPTYARLYEKGVDE